MPALIHQVGFYVASRRELPTDFVERHETYDAAEREVSRVWDWFKASGQEVPSARINCVADVTPKGALPCVCYRAAVESLKHCDSGDKCPSLRSLVARMARKGKKSSSVLAPFGEIAMTNYPGMGVMLAMLGGNESSVKAYTSALGKQIADIKIADDKLTMRFSDGSAVAFQDEGQSCCEHRFMVCADDLSSYVGDTFVKAELKDAPNEPDQYGDHEVQFLEIQTDKGSFSVANHNEHNGYYGGFAIRVSAVSSIEERSNG